MSARSRTGSIRRRIRQVVGKYHFRGKIVVNARDVALAEANGDDAGVEKARWVYWADGSCLENSWCGIGIAYRSSEDKWAELSWSVRGPLKSIFAEVCAIAKGTRNRL